MIGKKLLPINYRDKCPSLSTRITRAARNTRTASGTIELLLKAAGTQGAQGTQN